MIIAKNCAHEQPKTKPAQVAFENGSISDCRRSISAVGKDCLDRDMVSARCEPGWAWIDVTVMIGPPDLITALGWHGHSATVAQ